MASTCTLLALQSMQNMLVDPKFVLWMSMATLHVLQASLLMLLSPVAKQAVRRNPGLLLWTEQCAWSAGAHLWQASLLRPVTLLYR